MSHRSFKTLVAIAVFLPSLMLFAQFQQGQSNPVIERSPESRVPAELFVGFLGDREALLDSMHSHRGTQPIKVDKALVSIETNKGRLNVIKLTFPTPTRSNSVAAELQRIENIEWTSPNYVYEGDPREWIPNDPSFETQLHHNLMQNPLAWDVHLGSKDIVVAVADDGVETTHEDLSANIFTHPGEIADNNIDDDNNGFIDDVNGWDFSSNDNDPNPSSWDSHGTHVAGIINADINNDVGIAGTAPKVSVMPIRFYGDASWTSEIVARSYAYAVDNDAQIITTSYYIDHFVGDKVFEASVEYVDQNDVMQFNSAGNGSSLNPKRQAFESIFLVASTTAKEDSSDKKSSFSNWGTGIDVSAPGEQIYSTILNNKYGYKSGTSMASPNAAATAALIWSANPDWTREQVAAQMIGTCDNIDALNPNYAGLLGAGRVNTHRGLTETLKAPRIAKINELSHSGVVVSSLSEITVRFTNIFDRASVQNAQNWELRTAGPDQIFDTADDAKINLEQVNKYYLGTNELKFSFPALANGEYQFRAISGGLIDPFGQALDGNQDGNAGDDFVIDFAIDSNA